MNIKITVEVDGNEVYRNYETDHKEDYMWGSEVNDMLHTIEHSHDPAF